jgi:hypothetical protein
VQQWLRSEGGNEWAAVVSEKFDCIVEVPMGFGRCSRRWLVAAVSCIHQVRLVWFGSHCWFSGDQEWIPACYGCVEPVSDQLGCSVR